MLLPNRPATDLLRKAFLFVLAFALSLPALAGSVDPPNNWACNAPSEYKNTMVLTRDETKGTVSVSLTQAILEAHVEFDGVTLRWYFVRNTLGDWTYVFHLNILTEQGRLVELSRPPKELASFTCRPKEDQ